jgi:hypothetical protein
MALAALALSAPVHAGIIVINNSFEIPAFSSGGWSYYSGSPDGSWTYTSAGVANENSPWFLGAPPDGTQAAFCQNACTISQSLSGFQIGQSYSVSFYMADRPGYNPIGIQVLLGGADLGTYTPVNGNTAFVPVTTTSTIANATTMTLSFNGVYSEGDVDTALDLVTVNGATAAPEPSSMAGIVAAGLLGLLARRRFARQVV